jgi:outer membrane receptor protein involved in Fe transport
MLRSPAAFKIALLSAVSMLSVAAQSAEVATSPTASAPVDEIIVTAKRLDEARDAILPSLGASKYTFDRQAIVAQPQGQDRSLINLLIQAPGVTQDSYGQVHVRNEHGLVQYRINGVIVPESITGFGQTVDVRLADSVSLLTGTLPAQYGYRTSGVINIATQTGAFANGGDVGLYGGSRGTIEPSASIKGSNGGFNYFASGSYLRNDLGIENPTPSTNAIHDRSDQFHGFAYVSQILSDTSRVSAFGGAAVGRFQIPNNPDQAPNFTVNGVSDFNSSLLNQSQHEYTYFGVVAYQYSADALSVQVAPFVRYTRTTFTPDPNNGDIIFNGFSDRSRLSSLAYGVQTDASYKLSDRHTLRGGFFFQNERTRTNVVSLTLPGLNADGTQLSDQLSSTKIGGGLTGQLYGVYLQDEWSITPQLTLNFGARFDAVHAYTVENQFSPRINLVFKPSEATTFHAGYARDFTPPPQELVGTASLAPFVGTTKESKSPNADPVKAEREHYFDAGVVHTVLPGLRA